MIRGKIGLIGLASRFENGGERAETLLPALKRMLEQNGADAVQESQVVWDAADAVEAAERMARADVDAVMLVHLSWVQDSVQYILQTAMKKPLLLWAVPYAETFSTACVQHFGSILTARGIPYGYAVGLPDDADAGKNAAGFARAATAVARLRNANIGMIGPRQTWRIAGPQDTTAEEWDLTDRLGARIVHIEMDELRAAVAETGDAEARAYLMRKREAAPDFAWEAEEPRLLFGAKVALATGRLFSRYRLAAAGAQCYPANGGIANLASSWLADEGTVLDTEGDAGHTALLLMMNWLGDGAPAMLAETGKLDETGDCLHYVHEGSAAMSLSENGGVVQAAGDEGTAVGFALKAMPVMTLASLCGSAGPYRMLVAKAASLGVCDQDWRNAGRKFHGRLRFGIPAARVFDAMLRMGVDHHFVTRQGDCSAELAQCCRLTGIETLRLPGIDG
jgi:L-fucose isomerase-like protein